MENIKIGNLEYRAKDNSIVLWYPNEYYKAQKRLEKDGYVLLDDGSMSKEGVLTIHPSCFESKLCCYIVADIEWNRAHDEFDVRSIGTRAFDLKKEDIENFRKLLKEIEEQNNTEKYND